MFKVLQFITTLIVVLHSVESSEILGVFWTFSRSHAILATPLLHALAQKGHKVTLLSSYAEDEQTPNFQQIHLDGIKGSLEDVSTPDTTLYQRFKTFFASTRQISEKFWANEAIKQLIKSKKKYDVIITLEFFNDGLLALNHYLEAPTILFYPTGANFLVNKYVANPNLPYSVNILLSSGTPDTFFGRLSSISFSCLINLIETFYINPIHEDVVKKYLPDSPPVDNLKKNVSLVLVNGHHSVESPKPYVPNMIPIGGFHTQKLKALPKDLQQFLDHATAGAVLLSFGTNLELGNLQEDKLDIILQGLLKISPRRVIIKSAEKLKYIPENVIVKKWLPQNDILAHHNIKALISHGGLGANTEAVYHGVPILGIPFISDQKSNMKVAEKAGYAIQLSYQDLSETTFDKALREILENPKYTHNAKKQSSLLKNQPMDPMQKAIWWVEHIIEYKGGEHLKNVGMDLAWYELYMVDIIAFYLVLAFMIVFMSFYMVRLVLNRLLGKKIEKLKNL